MEQKGLDAVKAAVDQAEFVLVELERNFRKGKGLRGKRKTKGLSGPTIAWQICCRGKPIL